MCLCMYYFLTRTVNGQKCAKKINFKFDSKHIKQKGKQNGHSLSYNYKAKMKEGIECESLRQRLLSIFLMNSIIDQVINLKIAGHL